MIVLKDNKAVVISIIIFCVLFACAVTFVNIYVGNQRNIALEKAHYLTEANVSELDRALGSYMQATDTLRILFTLAYLFFRDDFSAQWSPPCIIVFLAKPRKKISNLCRPSFSRQVIFTRQTHYRNYSMYIQYFQ